MHFISRKFFLFLLILVGSVSWSLTMVKSGLVYSFGMGFWGPNGHDGVWHIALINRLVRGSLEMPIFAGETIKNYHLAYDAFLALVYKITGIPAHTLYFQIFPPILAILIGWLTYRFVLGWRKSEIQALWAVFFVYFGGSWGWLVTWLRDGSFGGESMFWANQGISTLINPPYAASLVLLLVGLNLLVRLQNKPSLGYLFFAILIFGVLIQVKVYGGILALGGLAIVFIWQLFKKHKDTPIHMGVSSYFGLFLGSLISVLFMFVLINKDVSSLIVFSPFWFPETMLSSPDRFYWPTLASAISSYKSGGNLIKLIPAEILALAIFWFGNLGTRVLKELLILRWIGSWRKLDSIQVFILTIIIAGIVLPLLFIQKGNPWNTIQFLYYSLFLSGILAGVAVGVWLERQKKWVLPAILLVLLTLPTTLNTLAGHYLPGRPPAAIPPEELKALEFLKRQLDGIVLTYPFNPELRKNWDPPQPLWVYETTSYVAAFSKKPVFLEDEMNLEITGYDWKERRNMANLFFKGTEEDVVERFLEDNRISYIYLVETQNLSIKLDSVQKIYDTSGVRIYRVL